MLVVRLVVQVDVIQSIPLMCASCRFGLVPLVCRGFVLCVCVCVYCSLCQECLECKGLNNHEVSLAGFPSKRNANLFKVRPMRFHLSLAESFFAN